MSANDIQNSPSWKKPNEVMQLHRLKMKKRALQVFDKLLFTTVDITYKYNYYIFYINLTALLEPHVSTLSKLSRFDEELCQAK